MMHTLDIITYSCEVRKETVHTALTMVLLHYLEVNAADVLNAYVTALNREKILTVLGPELVTMLVNLP